jgi:hypothetical protein
VQKLFVELNRNHRRIPGDGALVILDNSNDDVPAKTEAQQAAEGVAGSPVLTPLGTAMFIAKASDTIQDTYASAASHGSII